MARHNPHAALTDELVSLMTGTSPIRNSKAFAAYVDASSRTLKYHRYGRTNQFAVDSSLKGLVERFEVQGHEKLAAALDERVKRLSALEYKLEPETLSLLLHLSDHPAEQANVDKLDLLKEPDEPPELTWDDIIRDDPLPESHIWDVPDYHDHSDEDETTLSSRGLSRISEVTASSSMDDGEDAAWDPHSLLQDPDYSGLQNLRAEQVWRSQVGKANGVTPTELQFVRECIHMLLGNPTTLFDKPRRASHFVPVYGVATTLSSPQAVHSVMASLAEIGTALLLVRAFAAKPQESPLLQRFSAAVAQHIQEFDNFLLKTEKELINVTHEVIVSLLVLQEDVEQKSILLMELHDLFNASQSAFQDTPHLVLDSLFERTCAMQAIGNTETFETLCNMLSQCLQTYMEPLMGWMDHGISDDKGQDFVVESKESVTLSAFWKDCYSVRQAGDKPQAPGFLQPFVPAIFAEGKSVAFLQRLGLVQLLPAIHPRRSELDSHLASLISEENTENIVPFSATFHNRIKSLISARQLHASSILTRHLLSNLHLRTTLTALQTIYLSQTGSHFSNYADALFSRLSTAPAPNQYVIAELARTAFSSHPAIDERQITATLTHPPSVPLKSTKTLSPISINFVLSPVLQNIIQPLTLQAYQSIQKTLLTIRLPRLLLSSPVLIPTLTAMPSAQQARIGLYLRHRFLWLLTTLEDHCLHTAINLNILDLNRALDAAADVDALISAHAAFIRVASEGCLVEHGAGKTVSTLAELCVSFVRFVKKVSGYAVEGATMLDGDDDETVWDVDGPAEDDSGDEDELALEDPFIDKPLLLRTPKREKKSKKKPRPIFLGAGDLDNELRLRQTRSQLADLLAMLTAQLRSAARGRSDDKAGWDVLAERLEWGVNFGKRSG